MDSIGQLRSDIYRSAFGGAWHGPALGEALARVSAAEAAARPVPGAHSIWEIALHATAWVEEVTRRLLGAAPSTPARGDWPPPSDAEDWAAVQAGLARALNALDLALLSFPFFDLAKPVGGEGDTTYADMLAGLAQHNAYHAGQVVLLTRALRGEQRAEVALPQPHP